MAGRLLPKFRHGVSAIFIVFLLNACAAPVAPVVEPPAPACKTDRATFEAGLFENNTGAETAHVVTGDRALELTAICNVFPPASNIQSDMSVVYIAPRRKPIWALFYRDCLVAVNQLPGDMRQQLFGAAPTGMKI